MNLSWYVGHVTIVECSLCVLFSSRIWVRIRVRIRFNVWLISCCAHVFVLLYRLSLSHCQVQLPQTTSSEPPRDVTREEVTVAYLTFWSSCIGYGGPQWLKSTSFLRNQPQSGLILTKTRIFRVQTAGRPAAAYSSCQEYRWTRTTVVRLPWFVGPWYDRLELTGQRSARSRDLSVTSFGGLWKTKPFQYSTRCTERIILCDNAPHKSTLTLTLSAELHVSNCIENQEQPEQVCVKVALECTEILSRH